MRFKVTLFGRNVGLLEKNIQGWSFKYSKEFQEQNTYCPLFEFPDKQKEYRSKDLFLCFKLRIPDPRTRRPDILQIVHEEGLNITNEVEMLIRFGRKSMKDPYKLEPEY